MPLISLEPDMTIAYAAKTLLQKKIHGAPVLEDGKLVGIVTMTDIVSAFDAEITHDSLVSSIMKKNVITISDDRKLYEVIRRFKEENIGRIIVTENGKPAGILTHSDIVRVFPSL